MKSLHLFTSHKVTKNKEDIVILGYCSTCKMIYQIGTGFRYSNVQNHEIKRVVLKDCFL